MNKLTFICLSILLSTCFVAFTPFKAGDNNIYNKTYTVGSIPGLNDFMTMNAEDRKMEALYNESDQKVKNRPNAASEKVEFRNNRARVWMSDYENGTMDEGDGPVQSSVPSYCFMDKDTLFISMGISWTSGYAFNVKIFGDQFQGSYYLQADGNEKPYKLSTRGPGLNEITIKNKYQSLILDKKPSFKPGEQINGYLTYTTDTYYEKGDENKLNAEYVSGKLYFTCTVRGK